MRFLIPQVIQQRGFQATETEIEPSTVQVRTRKPDHRRITRLRQTIECRTTRVGESQHLGAFIKRLSRGVIKGFSQQPVFAALGDVIQVGMPSGHHEHDAGSHEIGIFQPRRGNMPFQMMHADTRHAQGVCQGLSETHPDDQRTRKSGPLRDRNRPKIRPTDTRLLKRRLRHPFDPFHVFSRSQLRDHSAETAVHLVLGRDEIRQQMPLQREHRGSRFVAGRFDSQETREWHGRRRTHESWAASRHHRRWVIIKNNDSRHTG